MSNEIERETVRLWRIWRTAREMCADRGYEFAEDELQVSLDDFKDSYADRRGRGEDRRKLNFSARPTDAALAKHTPLPTPTNPTPTPTIGTVWVEFSAETSIGIKHMRAFAHHITEHAFLTGILITITPPTPAAAQGLRGRRPGGARGVPGERPARQHHAARAGAQARASVGGGEEGAAEEVSRQGDAAAEDYRSMTLLRGI
ncbi:hypothetical protein MRB53_038505 [Persea americana]|nr:hypothetical protein MRB53_038505 [Persea americana]